MRIESSIWEDDPRMPATWRVLSALLREVSLSQANLRDRTRLSHPIIVQQVGRLRRAGLICLGQPVSGQPGRPFTPINFNWEYRRLLAVDVHRDGITAQIANLANEPQGEPWVTPLPEWSQAGLRQALSTAAQEAFRSDGPPFAGMGVSVPGAVSANGRFVLDCLDIADWCETPLAEDLASEFNMPVLLMNDADALARAVWAEQAAESGAILAVSLRHRPAVHVGIVIDDHLLKGASAYAGNIGHVPVAGNSARCPCGLTGCLETLRLKDERTPRRQSIKGLAEILAGLVTAFSPSRLVIQGDDAWTPNEMNLVRATLQDRCYVKILAQLTIEDRPSRTAETLAGLTSFLSGRILDLRHGLLSQWAAPVARRTESFSQVDLLIR